MPGYRWNYLTRKYEYDTYPDFSDRKTVDPHNDSFYRPVPVSPVQNAMNTGGAMYGKYAGNDTDFSGKYIVWSPTSSQPPKMVYDDRPTAIKVAYSMTTKFPHQVFTVCKVVGVAATSKVEYKDLDNA